MYSKISNITQKCVNLLMPFLSEYSAKISASELSKKTNIPQQTISRNLNELSKFGLIEFKLLGKNKLFYFDLKKSTSTIILKILENHKSLIFYEKNLKLSVILDELLINAQSIIVFGSYASGTNKKESDLDIVIINGNKSEIRKIKNKYFVDINEHYFTLESFEEMLGQEEPLLIEMKNNHVLLGKTEEIIDLFKNEKRKDFVVSKKERRNKYNRNKATSKRILHE